MERPPRGFGPDISIVEVYFIEVPPFYRSSRPSLPGPHPRSVGTLVDSLPVSVFPQTVTSLSTSLEKNTTSPHPTVVFFLCLSRTL